VKYDGTQTSFALLCLDIYECRVFFNMDMKKPRTVEGPGESRSVKRDIELGTVVHKDLVVVPGIVHRGLGWPRRKERHRRGYKGLVVPQHTQRLVVLAVDLAEVDGGQK